MLQSFIAKTEQTVFTIVYLTDTLAVTDWISIDRRRCFSPYGSDAMAEDKRKISPYYDGVCPKCVKDRKTYEKIAGKAGDN
jgi:hypothetical protein